MSEEYYILFGPKEDNKRINFFIHVVESLMREQIRFTSAAIGVTPAVTPSPKYLEYQNDDRSRVFNDVFFTRDGEFIPPAYFQKGLFLLSSSNTKDGGVIPDSDIKIIHPEWVLLLL